MKQILEKFTKVEIAKRCGVGYTTVLGWFKRNSMPTEHLPAVGCKIVNEDEEAKDRALKEIMETLQKNFGETLHMREIKGKK